MNSVFESNKPGCGIDRGVALGRSRPVGAAGNLVPGARVVVDWSLGEVHHGNGRRCKLSALEAALLACLARKAGTPVSRDELLRQVWRLDPRRTATRTVDMHISLLRRKLSDNAATPRVLLTVHGVGYKLHRGAISSGALFSDRDGGRGAWEATACVETLSSR